MKKMLTALALSLMAITAGGYEVKRTGGTTYQCVDPTGEIAPTNHNEWQALTNICGPKADRYGRRFMGTTPGEYAFDPTQPLEEEPPVVEEPPIEEPPVEEPPIEEPPDDDEEPNPLVATFTRISDAQAEPWPSDAQSAMSMEFGSMALRFKADVVTQSGQRMLHGEHFGVWLWQNQIHGDFYAADGTRMLWRDPDSEVVPGQERSVYIIWSPQRYVVFVDGNLHVHHEGATLVRSNFSSGAVPGSDKGGFLGVLTVSIFDDTDDFDYDACDNLGNWATINNRVVEPHASCLSDATLNWTPPTGCEGDIPFGQTVDNKRCGLLGGYKVYSGDKLLKEVPSVDTSTIVAGQIPGTCYEMTSFILAEENKILESVRSNESCK